MNFIQVLVNIFQFNRTNWKAVTLCLLAATVFWLFNAFNKTYATNIRFPLRFEYNEQKFIPVSQLPDQVSINVSGNGWDLFRKNLGLRLPQLIIPLERPADIKKIVGSTLPPMIINQLGGLKINYIVTDTLRLQLDERDSHKFKLVADLSQITFQDNHARISPVVILPDSVKLEGPKSVLHALPDQLVLVMPKKKLGGSYREDIEVPVYDPQYVHRNPPVVSVMFEVGTIEEIERYLRVKVIKPAKGRLQVSDSVKVLFRLPSNHVESFSETIKEVRASVDLSKVKDKGSFYVRPNVKDLPSFTSIVSIDSLQVTIN